MEDLLDRFFENLEFRLKRKLPHYVAKVSFYALVRKPRRKTLNNNLEILYKH